MVLAASLNGVAALYCGGVGALTALVAVLAAAGSQEGDSGSKENLLHNCTLF